MIYLDNAATTKPLTEVVQSMIPYLTEHYGNPGSHHSIGQDAANAVASARQSVADFLNCKPDEVVFTSGGSEGNNMIIKSLFYYLVNSGKTEIITDMTEHDSVLEAVRELAEITGNQITVKYAESDAFGVIKAENIAKLFTKKTGLVSVMYVNNETGAENPVEEIGALCYKTGILYHTDCVQAAGCHKIDVQKIGCDFATISSHKIHGPKGVGAVFVKDKSLLKSLISGGADQEYGLRAGTENVPGIVGFAKACEIANDNLALTDIHVSTLKQYFYEELIKQLGDYSDTVHINGPRIIEHGKTLNIRFDNVDAQTLVMMMNIKGVCVSTGSACRSHESNGSKALLAMGISPDEARESIRVSFSKLNTVEETQEAARITAECVKILLTATPQT